MLSYGLNYFFKFNIFVASKDESPHSPAMNREETYENYKCLSIPHDLFSFCLFGCICIVTELCFVGVSYLGYKFRSYYQVCRSCAIYLSEQRYFGFLSKHNCLLEEMGGNLQSEARNIISIQEYKRFVGKKNTDWIIQEFRIVSQMNKIERMRVLLPFLNNTIQDKNGTCSCLDIVMYAGNDIIALELLMQKNEKMILHKGEFNATCLHIAILQNKPKLVKACLENLPKNLRYELLHANANRNLVKNLYDSKAIKCTIPLGMAVVIGNEDILDILFEYGVDLDGQDTRGYSVFHTLVAMSSVMEEKAIAMYTLLIKKYVIRWWEQTLKSKGEKPSEDIRMEALYYLLNLKTKKYHMTPLVLAAYLGCKAMLERIINTEYVYRLTVLKGESSAIAYYDIKDINSGMFGGDTDECPSVIEVLVSTESDSSLECLDVPLLEDILASKWNSYFIHYFVFAIGYLIYMSLLTSTMYEVNIPEVNSSDFSSRIVNSPHVSSAHTFTVVVAVFGMLYGVWSFGSVIYLIHKRKLKTNIWRDLAASLFCVFWSVLVITRLILYNQGDSLQVVFYGISVVLGWSFCIYFLNVFRPTAIFSVMFERLLFRDFPLFAICYFFITCGFSVAIPANMNSLTNPDQFYQNWQYCFFTLFRTTIGLVELDSLFDENILPKQVYTFNIYLFAAYIIIIVVFLLNMLIASMTSAYSIIQDKKQLFWKKLRSHNIRLFERRMPSILQLINSSNLDTVIFKLRTKDCDSARDCSRGKQNSVQPSETPQKRYYKIKSIEREIKWYKMKNSDLSDEETQKV